jgi:hypothetical protein
MADGGKEILVAGHGAAFRARFGDVIEVLVRFRPHQVPGHAASA